MDRNMNGSKDVRINCRMNLNITVRVDGMMENKTDVRMAFRMDY